MEKYFNILKQCALFNNIGMKNLKGILGCLGAKVSSHTKGEVVISEGDEAKYIGIILFGTAQIEQVDYYGNRNIVANVETGELFCESFACAGIEYVPVDVVAKENTEVLMIECQRIIQPCGNACDFHRQMIYNLMKIVATKNLIFHQKIEVVSKRTTREKLMTYLLIQAKKNGDASYEIPYDRQELADYLGVDRSGLSVEIGRLCKEGVIRSRKRWFEIVGEQSR